MALNALVGNVATRLERTAAGWADRLESVAGSGGVAQRAGAEGVKAQLRGKNPARAVLKGVWQEGSPAVRAAVVTAAVGGVVLLLLSPALLLVYLLSWLVIAAVHRAQTTRQRRAAAT
ncbi:hypothetical protein [Nocardioides panaciterrulae]|uniref:Uncharacterized protein n=1 Tax=Nocardioides panaciterrulae TaxID=661492 RepID=A0A7Y9E377_9ACTN|nr:hypothetical protein [Nocardioides panaciterrulae]NYD40215.1 hypothetical protein [Nocardioides panaciterrulae]